MGIYANIHDNLRLVDGGENMRGWDPYEEVRRMQRRMEKMFEDFWARPGWTRPRLPGKKGEIEPFEGAEIYEPFREPFTDVVETDKEVIVTAEIPGVEKSDIKINATEDRIEISAETKREAKEEKKGYMRRERSYEKFYRALTLPATVDAGKAKASYKNGVLEVALPKTEVTKKTTVKVE